MYEQEHRIKGLPTCGIKNDARCSSCRSFIDIYGYHTLLYRGNAASAGFQLRHHLVQQSLGTILQQAGICHLVEPPHLHLTHTTPLCQVMAAGQTKPAHILLYSWRSDSHCCVDLVSVSLAQSGWRDADSALPSVEQGKRDKHSATCRSHGFDFIPFDFSAFGSLGPAADELPSLYMCAIQFACPDRGVGGACLDISPPLLCYYKRGC